MVTAVDASGNGNDGTYTGVLGSPGRAGLVTGDAAVFLADGPNRATNVLTPPSLLDFTGPFTFACLWVFGGSVPTAYVADNGAGFGLAFQLFSDEFIFIAGAQLWSSVTFSIAPGTAHLAAFSFDNTFPESTGVFYLDGVVVPNAIEPSFAIPAVGGMTAAGINADTADAAAGVAIFDEWACWNRVLSGGEIASLQGARGSFAAYSAAVLGSSPTAYYHLDEFPPTGWHVGVIAAGTA